MVMTDIPTSVYLVILIAITVVGGLFKDILYDILERRYKRTVMHIRPDGPTTEEERWL